MSLLQSTSKIDSNTQQIIDELFENMIDTNSPTDWFYKGFFRYFIEDGLQKKNLSKELCNAGAIIKVYKKIREKYLNFFKQKGVSYKRFSKASVYGIAFTPRVQKMNQKYTEIHKKYLRERQKKRYQRKKIMKEGRKIKKNAEEQTQQSQLSQEINKPNVAKVQSKLENDSDESQEEQWKEQKRTLSKPQTRKEIIRHKVKSKLEIQNSQVQHQNKAYKRPNNRELQKQKTQSVAARVPKVYDLKEAEEIQIQVIDKLKKKQEKEASLNRTSKNEQTIHIYQSLQRLKHQNAQLKKQNIQLKTVVNFLMKNLTKKQKKPEKFPILDHYLEQPLQN